MKFWNLFVFELADRILLQPSHLSDFFRRRPFEDRLAEGRPRRRRRRRLFEFINGILPNMSQDFMIRPVRAENTRGEGESADFGSRSGPGGRDPLRFRFRSRDEGSKTFGGGDMRPLGASGGRGWRKVAPPAPANSPPRELPIEPDRVRILASLDSRAFLRCATCRRRELIRISVGAWPSGSSMQQRLEIDRKALY